MASPKVSVVMIAFNSPEYIATAIESFLEQDTTDFELILVDDGSPNDIKSIVAPYADRVQYIRQDNAGPGIARDTGLSAAKGEYVAFGDSDDVHLPYRLGAQAAILDAYSEVALVCSDFSTFVDGEIVDESTLRAKNLGVDERSLDVALSAFGESATAAELNLPVPPNLLESRIYHGRVPKLIAGRHLAWEMASMFRRDQLKSLGGHDSSLRYWEDWHVTSRMAQRYDIAFWDAPVLLYRQHQSQITKQGGTANARGYRDVVMSVWLNNAELAQKHPELRRQMLKRATLANAYHATQDGEFSRARDDIFRFIRGVPLDRDGYVALTRNILHQVRASFVPRYKKY